MPCWSSRPIKAIWRSITSPARSRLSARPDTGSWQCPTPTQGAGVEGVFSIRMRQIDFFLRLDQQMLQTIGLWPAVVVATTLTLGSATVAYREFVPLLEGGTTLSGKLAALSAAPIEPGPSFRSKLLVVDDCAAAMNSFALASLDAEAQTRVFQHCRAVATAIVEEAPTYSYAWYVVALASEAEYDLTAMEQALLQAQTTSPHQEGLAYHRLILAFRHFNDLGQAAQHALASDVT